MPDALTARALHKRYARRAPWALGGIDLSINTGTVTALVGPNGAGKTTLLRTWVGFERPTLGSVAVSGLDPFARRQDAIGSVAYVPQVHSLVHGLSVADHVDLAASYRPRLDRAEAYGRLDGLRINLRQRASTLSGGQRAQLLLAIALASQVEVLLLDEPLASLDPLARRSLLGVVHEAVVGSRRTAVLSSHIISDIEAVCDRIVILDDGRVLLDASIASALGDHAVVDEVGAASDVVGRLPSIRGGNMLLVRDSAATATRPTLEEVVVGYLARAEADRSTGQGLR